MNFGDIGFTSDGRLWGMSSGMLYLIDTMNAAVAFKGSLGIFPVSLVGLDDHTLLGEDGANLYSINVDDLSTTWLGYIGYTASGDLAWNNGRLYMTGGYWLIEIAMSIDFSAITEVKVVNADSNLVYNSFGTLTISSKDCSRRVVVFEYDDGNKSVMVNTIDGNVENLCSGNLPDTVLVNGAASIDHPRDPAEFRVPNVFTPNNDGFNDLFGVEMSQFIESFEVYNRWGNKVFKAKENESYWDGNCSDTPCSEGVYYFLTKVNACSVRHNKSGFIHLIR
jgi:gliding motility-associated-like protein